MGLFSFNTIAQESIYDITINDISGDKIYFSDFKGKYILIVNVASECGFTPQYHDLETLQRRFDDLVIIGVPCNQFGGQEPASEKEISAFCTSNFNVSFLLTEKINVKGKEQHPLYQWLTKKSKNGKLNSSVKWNFQKYVIDQNGELVNYFYSITKPLSPKIISIFTQ